MTLCLFYQCVIGVSCCERLFVCLCGCVVYLGSSPLVFWVVSWLIL